MGKRRYYHSVLGACGADQRGDVVRLKVPIVGGEELKHIGSFHRFLVQFDQPNDYNQSISKSINQNTSRREYAYS
jgi:hypothetical protein